MSDAATPQEPRIALVTGAGSGIGRAVALALQGAGYHVVLTGRREAELEATAAAASKAGGRMLAIPADVSDPAAVKRVFAALEQSFGRLDLVFNNAGTAGPPVPLDQMSFEDWSRVVGVNLNGAFLCAKEAMRIMKAQRPKGGRIINNGSISATTPRPLSAPYTATKHALTGLTKSISLDGRADDIACSQIDIGNAATDLTLRMTQGVPQANGEMAVEPRMPVHHVAEAVLHMARLPLDVNVLTMTIMATNMPFVGRG